MWQEVGLSLLFCAKLSASSYRGLSPGWLRSQTIIQFCWKRSFGKVEKQLKSVLLMTSLLGRHVGENYCYSGIRKSASNLTFVVIFAYFQDNATKSPSHSIAAQKAWRHPESVQKTKSLHSHSLRLVSPIVTAKRHRHLGFSHVACLSKRFTDTRQRHLWSGTPVFFSQLCNE